VSVLIDTGVLVDYLRGDPRAADVVESHAHRAISALTWLETMAMAPRNRQAPTLAFLRSFERLSISEAIADEALVLKEAHPGLDLHQALNWATARANRLVFVSTLADVLPVADAGIVLAYSRKGVAHSTGGVSSTRR
jgi:predicted nucleic acid-binding protein